MAVVVVDDCHVVRGMIVVVWGRCAGGDVDGVDGGWWSDRDSGGGSGVCAELRSDGRMW